MSIVRLETRRLVVTALPLVLVALALALLAWTFLPALQDFLNAQAKLAAMPAGPGFTDLVAVPLLGKLALLGLLLAPLLGMSGLAGERRNGTLPLLFASGISPLRCVLGKFLALYLWLLLLLALTLAMPLALSFATDLDGGKLAAATLGVGLALAALLAVSLACSAFAPHPALAALASVLIGLALWLVNLGAGSEPGLRNYLALTAHLQPMLRGLVASADLVYFALLIALALALAILRLGDEKVRG